MTTFSPDMSEVRAPTFITLFSKKVWILTLLTGKTREAFLQKEKFFMTCNYYFCDTQRDINKNTPNKNIPNFTNVNVINASD